MAQGRHAVSRERPELALVAAHGLPHTFQPAPPAPSSFSMLAACPGGVMSLVSPIRSLFLAVAALALGTASPAFAGAGDAQVNTVYQTLDQRAPAVAMDGSGNTVVVWESD